MASRITPDAASGSRSWTSTTLAIVLAIGIATTVAIAGSAETAWVKDEVRLNLRSGPGTQYRILQGIGTGGPHGR